VRITGEDARHLRRSLRVRPGETVVVVEEAASEHGVLIDVVSDDVVEGAITWTRQALGEPALEVHALLALTAQRMDDAVANLVVAGAASIHPVLTERSVVRAAGGSQRMRRLRSVATNAAQLAGRGSVPEVAEPRALGEALSTLTEPCRILACVIAPDSVALARVTLAAAEVALVIGPEGGLAPTELGLMRDRGATLVHLGPRTLPHHLAGAVATSLLLAARGDLDRGVVQ
jgi:16S rRNA (uracil1498-N3)-methyltransferase